jgi:acyl-coenzyme A thioesterase PaaI-like protein
LDRRGRQVRHKVEAAQNISRMCFLCGVDNELGLHGRFFLLDNGELCGVFTPRQEHQGYPGRLHGGIIAALLDETIGRAINTAHEDTWGVTVKFSMRLRQPVPLGREVKVVGRITRDTARVFEGTGEIILEDGTVAAEGEGTYVKLPVDEIASAEFSETDWFADTMQLPAHIDLGEAS